MNNYTTIDTGKWHRKAQFEFFRSFDDPFFNITAEVEVDKLVRYARDQGFSFNLACLFFSQKVIHAIPEFRMRILDGKVVLFDRVHCGSTILMPDNSFRYCYFDHMDDPGAFDRRGKQRIAELMRDPGFNPRDDQPDNIHYSTIPWIHFTAVKHARRLGMEDSIPKIVLGKWAERGGRISLPVSVEVHHALLDGYHLGLYFSQLQDEINAL